MKFAGRTLMKRIQCELGQNRKQVYWQRGWTFQEWLFVRRRICSQNNCVRYECCASARYEENAVSDSIDDRRDWTFACGYLSIDEYGFLAKEFNTRNLSYEQDCLSAFSGLCTCYNQTLKAASCAAYLKCSSLQSYSGILEVS